MHDAGVAAQLDRHPGRGEPAGVRLGLVAQDVAFGGDDGRGRGAAQVGARSGASRKSDGSAPPRYRSMNRASVPASSPYPVPYSRQLGVSIAVSVTG